MTQGKGHENEGDGGTHKSEEGQRNGEEGQRQAKVGLPEVAGVDFTRDNSMKL